MAGIAASFTTLTATAGAASLQPRRRFPRRSSSFAVGTQGRKKARAIQRGAAARLEISMSALGTMKPDVVAGGVLHCHTPLIISKPMR